MCDFYNAAAGHSHRSAAACRVSALFAHYRLSPSARKENARVHVCLYVNLIEITLRWVCLPAAAEEMKLLCFKCDLQLRFDGNACYGVRARRDVKLYLKWVWAVTEWHSG